MVFKLDSYDKRILFELDRNVRIPDSRLGKLIGRSKESVRYRINKLQDQGIITGFSVWIDPTKLGYSTAKIYLSLTNRPQRKKEFVDTVKQDKRLFWLGVGEGAWNAGLTYFVRSNEEFFELKNELFSEFHELILQSDTGMLVDVNVTDKGVLYQTDSAWKTLFSAPQQYSLDDSEKKVLRSLFENGRVNIVDIARENDLTVDVVRNRMKTLEDRGVIVRYLARIDYRAIGYELYKTFLYFHNLSREEEARLKEYCRLHPNIIHFVRQISPWDVELEVLCENHRQYLSIINHLTQEFAGTIHKVETAIMSQDYVFPAHALVFE